MSAAVCACPRAERGAPRGQDAVLAPLLPAVLPWLATRRWFSHERGCVARVRAVTAADLPLAAAGDGARLLHLVIEVDHADGASHRYQLLVGARRRLPGPTGSVRTGLIEERSTASRQANPLSCGQLAVASESSRQIS